MLSSTKKKIRGWKRRIKEIERWKQSFINLDVDHLRTYQRDYAKLWISPFYALPRKTPPAWYNRILLQTMLEVYHHWNEEITRLGEPFYLKLWIYDPHFIHSQLVAAFKDCLHFYDQTFNTATEQRQFPFHKYRNIRKELEMFDWHLHMDSDTYTESDLLDNIERGWMSEREFERIKGKAYNVDTIHLAGDDVDRIYSVRVGDVWIGSIKRNTPLIN